MILFLDFEKAFDSLEWQYLFKLLYIMNFGPSFLTGSILFRRTSPAVSLTMVTPQNFLLYKEE